MDEFKKNGAIMIALTTVASGINYMSQIIMGRVLNIEVFGIMNTLFSIILVLSVPGTSCNMIVSKCLAQNNYSGDIIRYAKKTCMFVGAVILIIGSITSPIISKKLGTSSMVLLLTMLIIIVGYFLYIYTGIFAGYKLFFFVGVLSLIIPIFKILGVLLVAVFREKEILQQILINVFLLAGNIISIIIAKQILHRKFVLLEKVDKNIQIDRVSKSVYRLIIINFIYLLFSNVDVLLISFYIDTRSSGIYSAAMLFGKIIFFFTTSIVSVLLTFVSTKDSIGENPFILFKQTIKFTSFIIIISMLPINLFPRFFIILVYGEQYLEASSYIIYASSIAIVLSLLNIQLNYMIGIGKEKNILISFSTALIILLGVTFLNHKTIEVIIFEICVVLTFLFILNTKSCLNMK